MLLEHDGVTFKTSGAIIESNITGHRAVRKLADHTCAFPNTVQDVRMGGHKEMHSSLLTLAPFQVTDTIIVNPIPPSGTFGNLTSTITSNPSVGFPVTAYGYYCMNVENTPCPTDASSPLLTACTCDPFFTSVCTAGPVYIVPDLLAYTNNASASGLVGLGMSVSNSTLNDYEIGTAWAMHWRRSMH